MKTHPIRFSDVRSFLTSWGLHFDTPDEESNTIPYPQVYERMKTDIVNLFHERARYVRKFITQITETTDGQTYLSVPSVFDSEGWKGIEEAWHDYVAYNPLP
jgi:hypothetical protein